MINKFWFYYRLDPNTVLEPNDHRFHDRINKFWFDCWSISFPLQIMWCRTKRSDRLNYAELQLMKKFDNMWSYRQIWSIHFDHNIWIVSIKIHNICSCRQVLIIIFDAQVFVRLIRVNAFMFWYLIIFTVSDHDIWCAGCSPLDPGNDQRRVWFYRFILMIRWSCDTVCIMIANYWCYWLFKIGKA